MPLPPVSRALTRSVIFWSVPGFGSAAENRPPPSASTWTGCHFAPPSSDVHAFNPVTFADPGPGDAHHRECRGRARRAVHAVRRTFAWRSSIGLITIW